MPDLLSILETSLYVEDLQKSAAFYEEVMGLACLRADDRMRAYDVNGRSVLLLFIRGGTTKPVQTGGGVIPPHDGSGQIHIAFAVTHGAVAPWLAHLAAHDIAIEGKTEWQKGGRSYYFRDPDGHLLELASTPGLWEGF